MQKYEFFTYADKLQMINEHIKQLERDHYTWSLNVDRFAQLPESPADEKDTAAAQVKAIADALKVAKSQRRELENNPNGNGNSAKKTTKRG